MSDSGNPTFTQPLGDCISETHSNVFDLEYENLSPNGSQKPFRKPFWTVSFYTDNETVVAESRPRYISSRSANLGAVCSSSLGGGLVGHSPQPVGVRVAEEPSPEEVAVVRQVI